MQVLRTGLTVPCVSVVSSPSLLGVSAALSLSVAAGFVDALLSSDRVSGDALTASVDGAAGWQD